MRSFLLARRIFVVVLMGRRRVCVIRRVRIGVIVVILGLLGGIGSVCRWVSWWFRDLASLASSYEAS